MRYLLQAKLDGQWATVLEIRADSHPEAFSKAMMGLPIEHYDKPVRLEQVDSPPEPGGNGGTLPPWQ